MEKIRNSKLPDSMPATLYKYGDRTHNRAFQTSWLKQYPGLAYSVSQNGAYCMNCSLLGSGLLLSGTLIDVPFTNWKKAKETFDNHFLNIRRGKTKKAKGFEEQQKSTTKALHLKKIMESKQV